jgi:hypothetical protein
VDFTTSSKVTTPVSVAAVAPMIATADIGSGAVMIPAMVATKIANICQALGGKPVGGGSHHSTIPIATGTRNFHKVPSKALGETGFEALGCAACSVMTGPFPLAGGDCCRSRP